MSLLRGIEPVGPTSHDGQRQDRDGSIGLDSRGTRAGDASALDFGHVSISDLGDPDAWSFLDTAEEQDLGRPASICSSPPRPWGTSTKSLLATIPLQTYLSDENVHERRLLMFCSCPSLPSDAAVPKSHPEPEPDSPAAWGREADCVSEPPSSWDYVERDDEPGTDFLTDAGSWRPWEKSSQVLVVEDCTTSTSSARSVSSDSLADDVSITLHKAANAPVAARHRALDRQLRQAGLGGLGTSFDCRLGHHRAGDRGRGRTRVKKPLRQRRGRGSWRARRRPSESECHDGS